MFIIISTAMIVGLLIIAVTIWLFRNYFPAFIAVVVVVMVSVGYIITEVDKNAIRKATSHKTRIEVYINYDNLDKIKYDDEVFKRILENKKDTVMTYILREVNESFITVVMLQEDGSEIQIELPNNIGYSNFIKLKLE